MTRLAFDLPVKGNQQLSTSLNRALSLAFSALCCMTTITLEPQFTKSIAPPIPLATLPGIIQLAISPVLLTCSAPNMVMSRCPPLIIAKDSDDEKKDPPGSTVIVSLPAFIKSASSWPRLGYGPTPMTPFSAWTLIQIFGGRQAGRRVGIPIPRLTLAPSNTSLAALFIIFIRIFFQAALTCSLLLSLKVNLYIFFSLNGESGSALKIRSTQTPGTWISSGPNCPFSTISETSATTTFAAFAMSWLKFLAVLLKIKLPALSALCAFTNEKSPNIVSSYIYFLPFITLVGFGQDRISGICDPGMYFIGIPPFSTKVSTPALVQKPPIPAPPDRIFSANVPWGQNSNSISPPRQRASQCLLYPRQEEIILLTCLFFKRNSRPQACQP